MSNKSDSNQITREYFDSLLLEMRHFDSLIPSTKLNLYGKTYDTPIMTAALSHLNNIRPYGMVEMAKGCYMAKAVNWTGMGSENELEEIISTGANTIKIIKPHEDNNKIFRKIKHAEMAGAIAVGMDLDHAFSAKGKYDVVCNEPMAAKSLAEIKEFVNFTKLPFIIKGVLSEQDALKCLKIGVQGIVISHHHGIMEYAIPPLMILPKIAKIVDDKFPIFVDCGFENGMDVFKALALGATAVSVGRKIMGPLKENGAEGVKDELIKMTEQLAGVMARTCSRDLNHIDKNVIWKKY